MQKNPACIQLVSKRWSAQLGSACENPTGTDTLLIFRYIFKLYDLSGLIFLHSKILVALELKIFSMEIKLQLGCDCNFLEKA